ncbi:MAG: hypothetical protein FJ387_25045 [Verrucomicrobia bacterium]|nr:hypothetical protein [Verrucomicrobiota bacterium]
MAPARLPCLPAAFRTPFFAARPALRALGFRAAFFAATRCAGFFFAAFPRWAMAFFGFRFAPDSTTFRAGAAGFAALGGEAARADVTGRRTAGAGA